MSEVAAIQHPARSVANSSGYAGVYLHTPKDAARRWIGRVTINGKRVAVPGRYDTAQEAADARAAFIASHGTAAPAKTCEAA